MTRGRKVFIRYIARKEGAQIENPNPSLRRGKKKAKPKEKRTVKAHVGR